METNRLETFSDGLLAIVMTIMVLELKVPHEPELAALTPLLPVFGSYVLSFVNIGIFWNNHHHVFKATKAVNASVLWANLHLLFWISLLPFTTGWVGESHFGRWPTVVYGADLLLCATAYYILQTVIIRNEGHEGLLKKAVSEGDFRGKASPVLYACGIAAAWFFAPWAGMAVFTVVALMWLVPDRRVEKVIVEEEKAIVDHEKVIVEQAKLIVEQEKR